MEKIKIIIDHKIEGEFDKITIKDNGTGIPENLLDTIFEPLYTTKQDGTGLGLVSCKNTVEHIMVKFTLKIQMKEGQFLQF